MKNFDKIYIIGKYTFKEILKSRILYTTLIIGVALILVTIVATEFTYGVPERVALDFGLGMLSLSSLGISLFMGASLLSKEIDSRTVYMVISRPVPRWIFILGKICGLMSVLIVNVMILSAMIISCSLFLGGEINQVIILAILFNILECLLLMLVVVFFSLFSNAILASLISIVILVLGHAVKETQTTTFAISRPFVGKILEFYHLILPGFYKLNLKEYVIYQQTLEPSFLINAALYGVFYCLFVMIMIIYLFSNKNID